MYLQGSFAQTSVLKGFDQGRTIDRWVTVECKIHTCVKQTLMTEPFNEFNDRSQEIACPTMSQQLLLLYREVRLHKDSPRSRSMVVHGPLAPFWESAPSYYVHYFKRSRVQVTSGLGFYYWVHADWMCYLQALPCHQSLVGEWDNG